MASMLHLRSVPLMEASMAQATRRSLDDQLSPWLFGVLLVLLSIFSGSMSGQTAKNQPAQAGEASLLYHSQAVRNNFTLMARRTCAGR